MAPYIFRTILILTFVIVHCKAQSISDEEVTTPCPDQENEYYGTPTEETTTNAEDIGTTTIHPDDEKQEATTSLEVETENSLTEETDDNYVDEEEEDQNITTEQIQETTTLEPKLSVKTLLGVQKNSALLKLVQNRVKRQNYFPQPSYKPVVRTGQQQLRQKYQTLPYKAYQNPGNYGYYPSGNFKGQRRQYQVKSPSTSTSTVRSTVRRKFRPMPVFP